MSFFVLGSGWKSTRKKSNIKRKFPFKSLKFIACVNNFIVWDLVRSWKPDAMWKTRLYKVIGTQPSPLLCLSGTAGPSCGWRLHAGGCMLEEPNREVCQILSGLMEHLTHRRSRFELSHILMTPPEACHHGCWANTVYTFSQVMHIKAERISSTEKFIWRYKTVVTYTVCQFLLSCCTRVLCTRSRQLVCESLEFINKSNQCSLSGSASFLNVQTISTWKITSHVLPRMTALHQRAHTSEASGHLFVHHEFDANVFHLW